MFKFHTFLSTLLKTKFYCQSKILDADSSIYLILTLKFITYFLSNLLTAIEIIKNGLDFFTAINHGNALTDIETINNFHFLQNWFHARCSYYHQFPIQCGGSFLYQNEQGLKHMVRKTRAKINVFNQSFDVV